MADRPILFSAAMVRALIDGRKTQTRRVLNPQPGDDIDNAGDGVTIIDMATGAEIRVRFAEGDRLYVRESWRVSPDAAEGWDPDVNRGWIDYQTGGANEMVAPSFDAVEKAAFTKSDDRDWDLLPCRYRPGIHMPRWASRLTLIVTEVRVERLNDCSEADAIAEGVEQTSLEGCWLDYRPDGVPVGTARESYRTLWDSINGAGAWATNPFVVAVIFTVEQRNIDA